MRDRVAHRRVAFLALAAILLVAIMPTVSQLRAAWGGPHAGAMQHAMGGHEGSSHDHCDKNRGNPDGCFEKCGYCDFLGHAPSLASVPYLAILLAPAVPRATVHAESPLRSIAAFNAAHPRGPPSLLV